ncbi:MAG: 30S ribosomal protein S21 [Candidatus Nealsonbacteria bacterium]|nr:30S ribosomal protein S21 [Candidatus Nealsonbacteria bacterium]
MLEVKKQPTESSQSLVRRFTRGMQQSGVLFGARKRQFNQRTKSKLARKKAAIRREETKKEYEKLRKLGKLPEKEKRR